MIKDTLNLKRIRPVSDYVSKIERLKFDQLKQKELNFFVFIGQISIFNLQSQSSIFAWFWFQSNSVKIY